VEEHQPFGLAHRQALHHHRADQAENRGIGADAERQRPGNDHREARASGHVPQAELQIAQHAVHMTSFDGAGRLRVHRSALKRRV
jgi:hypothetical protein